MVLDTHVWLDWLVFEDPGIVPIRNAVGTGRVEIYMDAVCEEELARVLSAGGRVAFAEPDRAAGDELSRSLAAAGFEEVEVAEAGGEAVVSGHLP